MRMPCLPDGWVAHPLVFVFVFVFGLSMSNAGVDGQHKGVTKGGFKEEENK
jgi:hypothetical protein